MYNKTQPTLGFIFVRSKFMSTEANEVETGVKEFKVNGILRELRFTAATRMRLFLNVETNAIQEYISSDLFKITAVSLLLYGKEAIGKPVMEIIDRFDEDKLLDDEMEEIVGWVRTRTLNFMLKEAEEVQKSLTQVMERATKLDNSLTGLGNLASTK